MIGCEFARFFLELVVLADEKQSCSCRGWLGKPTGQRKRKLKLLSFYFVNVGVLKVQVRRKDLPS